MISISLLRVPGGSGVKNPPADAGHAGDAGLIPELGRFPAGGSGNIPVFLPKKIPWTEEPGRLQSMGLQRAGHD